MIQRRETSFKNQQEIVQDVETLAQGSVKTLGKHSFAEIVCHLAMTNDIVTGKIVPPKLPWMMRVLMPLMRSSVLNRPVKPGFKLPKNMEAFFWPNEKVELPEAINRFKASVEYLEAQGPLPIHPIFGKATREQSENLLLSHAAMHLSHVVAD